MSWTIRKCEAERIELLHNIERGTAIPFLVLSFLYIGVLIVPMAVHLPGNAAEVLRYVDWSIWAIFAVEFLLRLSIAPGKTQFLRANLFDAAIVFLPFLRPFRIIRFVVLLRAMAALARGTKLLRDICVRCRLNYVFGAVLLWLVVSAALVTIFEKHDPSGNIKSFADGIWWAFVTIFTVGYGDKYPVTPEGRGIAIALMAVGLGLSGMVAGTVASFFVQQQADEDVQPSLREVLARLERIERRLEALGESKET
jgi:voltage-gated potassium channel